MPCRRRSQKAHIKVCVVGNQDAALGKRKKALERLLLSWRICNHRVSDAGELGDFGRDRLLRVDKLVVFFGDFPVFEHHCADLGEPFGLGIEAGRLGVEHHELALQRLFFPAVHRGHAVVTEVGLQAVDDFELPTRPPDVVCLLYTSRCV